jgi:arylsulfatase
MIDGTDVSPFLLGEREESGRDVVLCCNGTRLQAVKWKQWKAEIMEQDNVYGTWSPLNTPSLYNLEWDMREEHQVGLVHGWVLHPMAAAVSAFLASLTQEPPIKVGTPDPYVPPVASEVKVEEHVQVGAFTEFVTTVSRRTDGPDAPRG